VAKCNISDGNAQNNLKYLKAIVRCLDGRRMHTHEEDGDVPLAKYIGKTNIGLKTKKRTERLGQGISRSID